ncbi:1-acyl-sn-glycerol-3-phosphate-acyltransferas-like protein [Stipitochalara longipes BDJ]|nr:1-acyl-sn-glycerol-3-phosphate-acyltransferas-like protein [Stipitochalara longipes BDJ]
MPSIGTTSRFLLFILNTLLCTTYGTFISLPLALFNSRRLAQWTTGKLYAYIMRKTTGLSFQILDPYNSLNLRPAVFITNHQSELDIVMMCTAFPKWCVVACKSSLKNIPFLGWYLAASGSVFVDKENSAIARGALESTARDLIREKTSVFLFPEGTRIFAKEPRLLKFKKGAFHLAVQAKVPIVPLVCGNYSDIFTYEKFKFGSGVIPVRVLQPIETSKLTADDVEELTRSTRELMLKEVKDMAVRSKGRAVGESD